MILNLCFGLAALIIRNISLILAIVLLLQCAVILILVTILERAGNMHERCKISP